MRITGNVFEDFFVTKSYVVKHMSSLFNRYHIELLNELETYFKSKQWAKNETEEMLWNLAGKGLSFEEKSDILGKSNEALRTMSSRLNTRLKSELFDNKKLYDVCTTQDEELIKYTIKHTRYLMGRKLNIYSELSTTALKIIDSVELEEENAATERDMFNALAFVAMHSKTTIKYQVERLNKEALEKVLELLSNNEYNECMGYYRSFIMKYQKPFDMSDTTIEKIKKSQDI